MKYWDDFHDKYGFGDGEAVPPDAWSLRYVYVREINRLAAANGSAVRLIAYDRPGCHNPYLICRVPADTVKDVQELELCKGAACGGWRPGDNWPEPENDGAMLAAIDAAQERDDIDGLVEVSVSITDKPRHRPSSAGVKGARYERGQQQGVQ